MSQVIIQSVDFHQDAIEQKFTPFSTRNKSPQHQKQTLIKKITMLIHDNNKFQIKKETLQNTVYDLRKLIEVTRKQSEEAINHLRSSIKTLQGKKQSTKAAIKYAQRDGTHLQKCMLYWNEFL